MASSDCRMSVYLGPSPGEGKELQDAIRQQIKKDVRFEGSEAQFARYCFRYTFKHDKTLK